MKNSSRLALVLATSAFAAILMGCARHSSAEHFYLVMANIHRPTGSPPLPDSTKFQRNTMFTPTCVALRASATGRSHRIPFRCGP